jgi:hypothetical protein
MKRKEAGFKKTKDKGKPQKNIISLNMIKDASNDSFINPLKITRKSTTKDKDNNCVYYQFKNSISQVNYDSQASETASRQTFDEGKL